MIKVSKRANSIGRTKMRMMFELERECQNVISFSIGEPNFHTPEIIVEACKRSLDAHQTGYAPNQGVIELREAISRHIERTHGVRYDVSEILVTSGCINALRATAQAILDPDDEVILPNLHWPNHHNHPILESAVPIEAPVSAETNFMYDVDRLQRYVTPKTAAIVLNSPANPTGAVMDRRTMERLCEFVKKNDLMLVSDEVYERLLYDGTEFVSPVMFDGMKERTIVVNSLSKSHAMTGWRLGWAVGPKEIISAMLRMNENTLANPTTFVQYAAIEALEGDQSEAKRMVQSFQRRRDLIYRELNTIPGITAVKPKGAFYIWADIRGTGLSSDEFATRLIREKSVGLTPGSGFGSGGEGYVRLSYALSEPDLLEGVRRIREFVASVNR
ncbi:MAG: pyridoxal phosphate-dependent aminotransferase [Candidatus Excrementavichristensenella sp.]|jgi:aminotransferase